MSKLSWTQPICEACWIEQEGTYDTDEAEGFQYLVSVRQPMRLQADIQIERCSWCGKPTIMGIYKRHDPTLVPFPAVKE